MSQPLHLDKDALAGFRRGDARALESVYRALVDDVAVLVRRGFTMDRTGGGRVLGVLDLDEQRDLVQEVFARAFSKTARASYDGVSPIRPYVLRIAKNLMIDRLRRLGREQPASAFDEVGDIDAIVDRDAPFSEDQSPAALDERRLQRATRQFVDALGEPERTVYRLRYREGLPQHEVASRMGVSRRQVRTAEERLREGLLAHLGQAGLAGLLDGDPGPRHAEAARISAAP